MIDGTPRPDYARLELAHDLLATAQAALADAMMDADEFNQYHGRSEDEGLLFAQSCEQHRQEAIGRIMDATHRIVEAGKDLPPFVPGEVPA